MKSLRYAVFALLLVGVAQARPIVLEEVATLPAPPGPAWTFLGRIGVAIDLNYALVLAERAIEEEPYWEAAALLYRREGQSFVYQGQLGPTEAIDEWTVPGIAMKDGVAIVILKAARVFQQVGTTSVWNEEPVASPYSIQGEDIEVHAQHIMVSGIGGRNYTKMLRKGADGTWRSVATFEGNFNSGGDTYPVPFIDLDVGVGRAVVFNEQDYLDTEIPAFAGVYGRVGNTTSWTELTRITTHQDVGFGPEIAISSNSFVTNAGHHIAITTSWQHGATIYFPDPASSGATYAESPYGLQSVDSYLKVWDGGNEALERAGESFVQREWSHDRKAYVINGYDFTRDPDNLDENGNQGPDPAHSFTHSFQLQARNGASLGDHLDAHGSRIIVSGRRATNGDNTIRVFDTTGLVSQWPVRVYDFEADSSGSQWQPTAGSAFSRAKVGYTWVYRQASTAGNPTSILPPPVITARKNNQSIQSEVTLNAFSGPNAWVGLLTRYHDPSNYYYVTLRAAGAVEVKRMVNGVFTTLASAPASVVVGRKYRLRLESIGTTHRVYLDDKLVLTARDSSLTDGYVGIMMNRAAADYDNVTLSPSPLTSIYTADFATIGPYDWKLAAGSWAAAGGVYRQSNASGYGIAFTGALADDHVVRARIRPTSFTTPQDWVGLTARYLDSRNYLYVNWQGRGVISLWRRNNNVIQQLATQRLAVTPGTWYDLRLEVVAGTTRVFVNDQLVLASNADPGPDNPQVDWSKGQVGLITHNATADFDDFLAYQP
jgi:hypothetical protein